MGSFLLIYTSLIAVVTQGCAGKSPTLHKRFTIKELTETFGVGHHDHVPVYASTRVHGNAKLRDDSETSFSLRAFGKRLQFNVSENKDFLADTHTTEFVNANGDITKYVGVLGEYSFGRVHGDPLSHVALHHSGKGLSGSIRTSDDLYMISPLPLRFANRDNHIIYRASDNPNDPTIKKIRKTEEEISKKREVHRRSRRSTEEHLPKKTVELLVAADYSMLDFYGNETLPTYMLAAINIMAGFFRDISLPYPVDVVVVRSVILTTDIFKAPKMKELLYGFSTWCNQHNNFDDQAEDHFDAGLLMTRDGCTEGCGIVGLARFSEICNFWGGHAVAMDRGFMVSVILAHELGHVFGAVHDGGNVTAGDCKDSVNIMATSGTYGGIQSIKWSNCSAKIIEAKLRSSRSNCLNDLPPKKRTDPTFQLYGTVYDADYQCKKAYNNNYQRCIYEQDSCGAILCNLKGTHSCVTRFFPALHGTHCGQHKWCIMGTCVPDGNGPKKIVVHGGWSAWGDYTDCNKPCNVGVQYKKRSCNNPTPEFGGSLCTKTDGKLAAEENGHFRSCNTERCQADTSPDELHDSDRDLQCQAKQKTSVFCKYCPGIGPCNLWCGELARGLYEGHVTSGTICYLPDKVKGICVAGTCTEVGCDYKLNSGLVKDRCGVCNGNGNTCRFVKGHSDANFPTYDHHYLTTIPVNASAVVIEEGDKTKNFLACKVSDRYKGGWDIPPMNYGKTVKLDGAEIYYKLWGFPNKDRMTITGVLKVPVHIFYSNQYYHGTSHGVNWNYEMVGVKDPADAITVGWEVGAFSECSETCGGGTKTRKVYCKRRDDQSYASLEACDQRGGQKPASSMDCNTANCPASWYTSGWTDCSLTCGTGIRTRTVTCSEKSVSGQVTVDASKCTEAKPTHPTTEKCNDETCPPYWDNKSAFTPCSTTCEKGVQKRKIQCMRIHKGTKLLVVPELECIAMNTTKPATLVTCNEDVECPKWTVEFGKCSVTCGKGTQDGIPVCISGAGGACDPKQKPDKTVIDCTLDACPTVQHHWKLTVRGCNVTCGTGLIVKELACMSKDQNNQTTKVEAKFCDGITKPVITEETCKLDPCPSTTRWSEVKKYCATGCGRGYNVMEVNCIDVSMGMVTAYQRCVNEGVETPSAECNRNISCKGRSKNPALAGIVLIGCFKDIENDRRIPQYYADYSQSYKDGQPLEAIKKCADGAKKSNFHFFALQNNGECWIGGTNARNTYDTAGKSSKCSKGTGTTKLVNFVFHIGGPVEAVDIHPVVKHGCLLLKASTSSTYTESYLPGSQKIVPICGLEAYKKNWDYFGGDSDGNCLTSETIRNATMSPSLTRTCFLDQQGMMQYHIYTFVRK